MHIRCVLLICQPLRNENVDWPPLRIPSSLIMASCNCGIHVSALSYKGYGHTPPTNFRGITVAPFIVLNLFTPFLKAVGLLCKMYLNNTETPNLIENSTKRTYQKLKLRNLKKIFEFDESRTFEKVGRGSCLPVSRIASTYVATLCPCLGTDKINCCTF